MADNEVQLPTKFGDYVLLEKLGQGTFGAVFLARAVQGAATPLVVKRLKHQTRDAELRSAHEAKLVAAIASPHVPKIHDVGTADGWLYIAMEHVEGWTLQRLLQVVAGTRRKASLESIKQMALDGLAGLSALHTAIDPETGIPLQAVHRDIKPSNLILREKTGELVLIDLGLGKSNTKEWKTRTGALTGTPGYMAPEQVIGGAVDHRTDLYAFGLVLYELTLLRRFFPRQDDRSLLRAMRSPEFLSVRSERPEVPAEFDELLRKALQPRPEDRFQSATEMGAALEAISLPESGVPSFRALGEELLGEELGERTQMVQTLVAGASYSTAPRDIVPDVTAPMIRRSNQPPSRVTLPPSNFSQPPPSITQAPGGARAPDESRTVPLRVHPQVALWRWAAVSGWGLLAAVGLVLMLRGEDPAPPATPSPSAGVTREPPTPRAVGASGKETARTTPDPVPEPDPEVSETPRTKARPKKRPRDRTPTERVAKKSAPKKLDPQAALRAVRARAKAVRRAHPERGDDIDDLLGDAVLWSRADDPVKATRELRRIRRALEELAK